MREAGVLHHNAADVGAKILNLQASYNKAWDWSETTDEGIWAAVGSDAEKRWEEEREEKRRKAKEEEEERKRGHEAAMMQAKTERAVAKGVLAKSLSDLGLSKEELLRQLEDL